MLGLLSVLREIVEKLGDVVTQLTAIAANTTPAVDPDPDPDPDPQPSNP